MCAELGRGEAWGAGALGLALLCPQSVIYPLPFPEATSHQAPLQHALRPQVFEEEHHVLYLDHGGVIAAIKDTSIPLKVLK